MLQLQVLVLVVIVMETIRCLAPWFRSYLSALSSGPVTFRWAQFLLSFPLLPSVLIGLQWTLASLSRMYCQRLPLWVHSTPQGVSAGADSLENIFDSETQSKLESLRWLNQLDIRSWKKSVGIAYKLVGPILKAFFGYQNPRSPSHWGRRCQCQVALMSGISSTP